ncbi:hypothetical protein KSP40_PGU001272 [Platanthera guangdongensis]|uniref:Uncharacterized protein n=1 Tax=Platanthera guangdongensis TaxID=2320717 RepID=A0ABR2LWR4_9ASPA
MSTPRFTAPHTNFLHVITDRSLFDISSTPKLLEAQPRSSQAQVAALRDLTKEELFDFFNCFVKVDSQKRKTLSVQVYGGLHSAEYKVAVTADADQPRIVRISDSRSAMVGRGKNLAQTSQWVAGWIGDAFLVLKQ